MHRSSSLVVLLDQSHVKQEWLTLNHLHKWLEIDRTTGVCTMYLYYWYNTKAKDKRVVSNVMVLVVIKLQDGTESTFSCFYIEVTVYS